MNHNKLFPRVIFSLIFIYTLFFITCKENPVSSKPLDVVATSQIGPGGGSLETGEFILQVPDGCFNSDLTLNLYISVDPSGFGENSVSQSFMVDGLPDVIQKPLRLAIKYSGELSDSTYITNSVLTEDFSSGDSTYVSYFIPVKDSAGFVVGELNPITEDYLSKSSNISAKKIPNIFEAITNQEKYRSNHFRFDYSAIYAEATVQQFANLMEGTLNKIETELGFIFDKDDLDFEQFPGKWSCVSDGGNYLYYCWYWPIKVTIKDVNSLIKVGYPKHWMSSNGLGPFINADETLMGSSIGSQAELLIAQTLLEIAQKTNKNYDFSYWWFGEAIQHWLEDYFNLIMGNDPPSNWVGNELTPFNGMQTGWLNYSSGVRHDMGMVTLVKYLVNINGIGNKGLADIFKFMETNDVHIVNAILNSANGLVADWWPDFFEKLIGGDIYNVSSTVFTNSTNISGTWDIDSEANILKVFNNSYADLSAKEYLVNLNYSNIDAEAGMHLSASGNSGSDGIATLVYGLNGNNLQHLVTSKNGSVVLPKMKEYYDNGIRQFLIVVVNSTHNTTNYMGTNDIELEIEIKKETPTLYTTCEVEVEYRGEIHEVVNYESSNLNDIDATSWTNFGFTFGDPYSEGSFTGNTFTYDYVQAFDNGNTYDIHFSLIISDDKSEITNIDYTYYSRFDGNAGTSENDVIHNLVSIPLEQVDVTNNEATYYIGGVETCNSIDNVSSSYDNVIFNTLHGTKNLVDHECDQNSFIRVILK